MTDFAIANDGDGWDLVLDDGDLVLTHTLGLPAEVAQRVVYRLMTWLGESPYDLTAGVPYEQLVFGFEPVPGIVAYLVQIVLDTEGVTDVATEPDFELDDRTLTITLAIVVGTETVPIELQVTP